MVRDGQRIEHHGHQVNTTLSLSRFFMDRANGVSGKVRSRKTNCSSLKCFCIIRVGKCPMLFLKTAVKKEDGAGSIIFISCRKFDSSKVYKLL